MMYARLTKIDGEVYRGRGRGPGSVWAGLRAVCDGFEKSIFLALEEGRKRTVPEQTISIKIAETT